MYSSEGDGKCFAKLPRDAVHMCDAIILHRGMHYYFEIIIEIRSLLSFWEFDTESMYHRLINLPNMGHNIP